MLKNINGFRLFGVIVTGLLVGLLLIACGDNSATTTSTPSATITKIVQTSTALPTFTAGLAAPPAISAATTTITTMTLPKAVVGSDAAALNSSNTDCGQIPYYVPPKLDAKGLPISPIYAAMGASDTVGIGSTNPVTDSWTAQLSRLLPANFQYLRLGIGSITLHRANQCLLPKLLASHPTLISDWNTVNDALQIRSIDSYRTDLEYFLQESTTKTAAKILLGNMPDLSLLPFIASLNNGRYDLEQVTSDWNKAIAQEVAKYPGRVYLVDLRRDPAMIKQHPEWLYSDGLHPTTVGYVQITQAFWNVISVNNLLQPAP